MLNDKSRLKRMLEQNLITEGEITEALETLESNPEEDPEAAQTLRAVLREWTGKAVAAVLLLLLLVIPSLAQQPEPQREIVLHPRRAPQVYVCVNWNGKVTLRPQRQIFELCWVPKEGEKPKTKEEK